MTVELGDQDRDAFLRKLLTEVAAGRLGPDEADERAWEAGWVSLSNLIAPEDDWPRTKPNWTVPMVLAWISWRTYSEVREWDRDYLSKRREWGRLDPAETNPGSLGGFALFRRNEPNSAQFARWGNKRFGPWVVGRDEGPAVLQAAPAADAVSLLLDALAEEMLVASAIPPTGGANIDVPAREFADLEFRVGPTGEDAWQFRHEPNVLVYRSIRFHRRAVLRIWPAHRGSDLEERAEFVISPIVDDAGAREALYSAIEAEEFEPDDGNQGGAPRMVKWGPRQLEELSRLNEESVRDRGRPLTIRETVLWAKSRGISREGAREMRKVLRERCEAVGRGPGGPRKEVGG
ncbi:hypothetical protein [Brevundimonas sp. TWP2-3-4b1]|uniref:hypothetical protein n=1 Tax=Brevundimonas sp. TWP2-3-4b1 TaxID=2804580 RepID=UPI003CF65BA4